MSNAFVCEAGEDVKIGDLLIIAVEDGKVYRHSNDRTGIVISAALKDTKKGEKINVSYPLFGEKIYALNIR